MAEDLTETIVENAAGPAEVTVDGQTVKAQRIQDQIAADRYAKAQTAAAKTSRGLRFSKLVPPGTV